MKESNEDSSDSSDNSVTSEEGDFKTLMINNKNDSEKQNNNINNITNNNNSINNNDDIRKKYKSIISFSVISEMDDKYKEEEEENIDDNNNIQDLRASDVPNNNISIWEAIKQKISNFKNQIVFNYNLFKGLKNLKLNAPGLPKEIHIFDEIYSKQDEELINKLKNIPWFSYRKDFDQIKDKETIYTSDAGW